MSGLQSAVIAVDYEEWVKNSYQGITAHIHDGATLVYRSGDFVQDYADACAGLKEAGITQVSCSSSVFDYMRLEGYEFEDEA